MPKRRGVFHENKDRTEVTHVEHKVACPQCHSALKSAKPIPAGMKLKCPRCGTMFSAPHASANGPHNGALASAGGAAVTTAVQTAPAAVPAVTPSGVTAASR